MSAIELYLEAIRRSDSDLKRSLEDLTIDELRQRGNAKGAVRGKVLRPNLRPGDGLRDGVKSICTILDTTMAFCCWTMPLTLAPTYKM